jgi:hypothetical protein
MHRSIFVLTILLFLAVCVSGQEKTINDTISVYFREIQANTNQYTDLWDIDLYGPILLVDPGTRQIYANYPDTAGILKPDDTIFTGTLPDNINIANTAINWNGKEWAMALLPLPKNKQERFDLLSHELFHRSQQNLGFDMKNPDNNHLDQKDGRIYLRLELEALQQAFKAKTITETKTHLTNALIFRKYRYTLFPDAALSENLLELNEGIASYTGIAMSGRNESEMEQFFDHKLTEFLNYPTFVRSFVYITTPLYGFILNRTEKYWNKQINNNTNLTDFFMTEFNLSLPENPEAAIPDISSQYGSEKIILEETAREQRTKQRVAEYKTKFIEQPHLEIMFEKMNISFDTRNIMPLEDFGTVYPTMRVSDNWGILVVSNGALLGANWDKVTVTNPTKISSERIEGDGWTLEINKGYIVEKNNIDGNYILKKQ